MNYPDIQYIQSTKYTKSIVKSDYPEFADFLENNYPKDLSWKQKMYWFYHELTDHPKCPICGGSVSFLDFTNGYRKYCSCACANKDLEYRSRIRKTCLEKYGVDNPQKNDDIKEKRKQMCLEKYGVDNPQKNDDIKEKRKQTCLKKYGVKNVRYFFTDIIDPTPNEYSEYKRKCPHPGCNRCKEKFYWADVQLHGVRVEFHTELCTRLLPRNAQFNKNTSIECFVHEILDGCGVEYEKNNRTVLDGKELDVYIPSRNLAIECNGVRWHSVDGISPKDKHYHFNKWLECKNKGIELITLWDYQIRENPERVKDLILKKLGMIDFYQECIEETYVANNDFDFIPKGYVFVKTIEPQKHVVRGMTYYDSGGSLYRKTLI